MVGEYRPDGGYQRRDEPGGRRQRLQGDFASLLQIGPASYTMVFLARPVTANTEPLL